MTFAGLITALQAVVLVCWTIMKGTPVWVPPLHISASCVSVDEAIDSYLAQWSRGNRNTERARRIDLEYFREFCRGEGLGTLADLNGATLRDFAEARVALGEAPATVRRRFDFVKWAFSAWAVLYPDFFNAAEHVVRPQVPQTAPNSFEEWEAKAIRDQLSDPRDVAIYELMFSAGLRCDDVRELQMKNLDIKTGHIRNLRRKGLAISNIPILSPLLSALDCYWATRDRELFDSDPHFDAREDKHTYPVIVSTFRSTPGDPKSYRIGTKTLYNVIRNAGDEAGVDNPHPHRLRHSYAHDVLSHTDDLKLVAQLLGHRTTRTTERYTMRRDSEIKSKLEGMRSKA